MKPSTGSVDALKAHSHHVDTVPTEHLGCFLNKPKGKKQKKSELANTKKNNVKDDGRLHKNSNTRKPRLYQHCEGQRLTGQGTYRGEHSKVCSLESKGDGRTGGQAAETDLPASMLRHFSRGRLFATPWTVAHQLFWPWGFPRKNTGVGCHFLL